MANTKEITTSGQNLDAVHCLTIPLQGETALLPNASIAEVIIYKEPTPLSEAPEWFLGHIDWRDRKVPIISFEGVSGRGVYEAIKSSRIAVLNTINGNSQIPYIGIVSQGIPSLAIVQEKGLEDKTKNNEERQAVGAFVKVGGLEAIIPNVDEMEQRLIRLNLV